MWLDSYDLKYSCNFLKRGLRKKEFQKIVSLSAMTNLFQFFNRLFIWLNHWWYYLIYFVIWLVYEFIKFSIIIALNWNWVLFDVCYLPLIYTICNKASIFYKRLLIFLTDLLILALISPFFIFFRHIFNIYIYSN